MRNCVINEFDQTLVCMTLLFQGEKDTSDIATAEQSYTYVPESAICETLGNSADVFSNVTNQFRYFSGSYSKNL